MSKIYNLKYLYFVFILLSSPLCSQTKINESEFIALKNFYQQTEGEHWNIQWDFDKDPFYWYGIKLSNGNVTEIKLNGNNLKGKIPSLSAFSNLKRLDLSANQLSGSISTINSISGLTYLDISENNFEGDISNELVNNSNLTELNLGKNKFTLSDSNSFLQNHTNITHLDLSDLNLKSIPKGLLLMNNLIQLVLNNNALENNYSTISALKSIEYLSLKNNKVTIINDALSQLSNLKSLNLEENFLTNSSIQNLSQLKNLEWLSLEKNELTSIPSEIQNLKNLLHLNLGRNKISNGFTHLNSLIKLQQLWLNNNYIEGNFPFSPSDFPNLMFLSITSNALSGKLPSKLSQITDISNNRYTLNEIRNYITENPNQTEFIYSPQRYDVEKTITTPLGNNALLSQSLNIGEGYQISWLKNLDNPLPATTESLNINNVKEEDYTKYTAEAYYIDTTEENVFEIAFFREPITLQNSLNVQDVKKHINIYPNPTKDYINIVTSNINVDESYIYDMSGKLILQSKQEKIDVSSIPSGAYVISITTSKGIISYKFIKK